MGWGAGIGEVGDRKRCCVVPLLLLLRPSRSLAVESASPLAPLTTLLAAPPFKELISENPALLPLPLLLPKRTVPLDSIGSV